MTRQPELKRATHCMYAYRVQNSDSPGPTITGQNDGGENGSGDLLARLLEQSKQENVIVVVSRWYGGVQLGSERWRRISEVARDALNQLQHSREEKEENKILGTLAQGTKKKKRKK